MTKTKLIPRKPASQSDVEIDCLLDTLRWSATARSLARFKRPWRTAQAYMAARHPAKGTLDASDEPKQDAASDRHEYFTRD